MIGSGRVQAHLAYAWLILLRAGEKHLALFLVEASLAPDQLDPFLGVAVGLAGEVEVARRREEAEDVGGFALGVALAGGGGELAEVDLVAEFGLVSVFVDGEEIGAEDEVDGSPGLNVFSVGKRRGGCRIGEIPLSFVCA